MENIKLKILDIKHCDYPQVVALINEVLRKPFNYPEYIKWGTDNHNINFVAYYKNEIIGCNIVTPEGDALEGNQFAIKSTFQKHGIGTKLMQAVENYAIKNNYKEIAFNARLTAMQFYENLGYSCIGEPFKSSAYDLMLIKMNKNL